MYRHTHNFPDVVADDERDWGSCSSGGDGFGCVVGIFEIFATATRARGRAHTHADGAHVQERFVWVVQERERGPKDIRAWALNRYVTRNAARGLCEYTHAFNNAYTYYSPSHCHLHVHNPSSTTVTAAAHPLLRCHTCKSMYVRTYNTSIPVCKRVRVWVAPAIEKTQDTWVHYMCNTYTEKALCNTHHHEYILSMKIEKSKQLLFL
jgi:hypothetical protein